MEVRIGAVTGDAGYFLLSEKQRREAQLPKSACVKVVTRARHLRGASIGPKEWERLRVNDERVWLFRPTSAGELELSTVRAYLCRGEESGGCHRKRLKVRSRKPWCVTPLPKIPDAFMSGMTLQGPWLCFRGLKCLSVTNTLYGVRFRDRKLSRSMQYGWALSFLCSRVRHQLRRVTRRYADGLAKLEPGDLHRLRLPEPSGQIAWQRAYERAARAMADGDVERAVVIADRAILRSDAIRGGGSRGLGGSLKARESSSSPPTRQRRRPGLA